MLLVVLINSGIWIWKRRCRKCQKEEELERLMTGFVLPSWRLWVFVFFEEGGMILRCFALPCLRNNTVVAAEKFVRYGVGSKNKVVDHRNQLQKIGRKRDVEHTEGKRQRVFPSKHTHDADEWRLYLRVEEALQSWTHSGIQPNVHYKKDKMFH